MNAPVFQAAPASRPPLERMMRIHQAIQSGKFPNGSTLARELEVSTKSIQRDIEFMRDRLSLPIEYNAQRNGYAYTEEVTAFPTMQITEGEFVALVLAEKALQQYRGTNFERPLLNAIDKIKQSLQNTVSLNFSEIEQTFSFSNRVEPILNMETFDSIAKATTHRQQIEITYRKPGQKTAELRTVDPYHLANINGEWYLFAYDHARKDIRTFAPIRIQSVKLNGKTFASPKNFSLVDRLRDSFGVYSGGGEFKIAIRFNARAADFVREKKWHESQQLRELKGGGLELSLKLSSLAEVQRWVLSWGGDATVLKPLELVESVRAAAKKILAS